MPTAAAEPSEFPREPGTVPIGEPIRGYTHVDTRQPPRGTARKRDSGYPASLLQLEQALGC